MDKIRCKVNSDIRLQAIYPVVVRFNEVDSMGVVWHGNYAVYLEQAREEFGKKYGLTYLKDILNNGYYAPVVKLDIEYKRILKYTEDALVRITYLPTLSPKIYFEYEIFLLNSKGEEEIIAKATSIQVFTDLNYNLVLENPDFYKEWKNKWIK